MMILKLDQKKEVEDVVVVHVGNDNDEWQNNNQYALVVLNEKKYSLGSL